MWNCWNLSRQKRQNIQLLNCTLVLPRICPTLFCFLLHWKFLLVRYLRCCSINLCAFSCNGHGKLSGVLTNDDATDVRSPQEADASLSVLHSVASTFSPIQRRPSIPACSCGPPASSTTSQNWRPARRRRQVRVGYHSPRRRRQRFRRYQRVLFTPPRIGSPRRARKW